jgi:DNA-directed RNA polymerase subunit M/transcription elongation factor TFIIS
MFYKVCPKCGGYIFIDDDGVSKAVACLNCGYRRELDDHLKPYEPIDKKEPVRMVKL